MSIILRPGRLSPYPDTNPSTGTHPITVGDVPMELLLEGVNRFTVVIESLNGAILTRDLPRTTLSARIYASSGEDITDLLREKGLPLRWESTEYQTGAGFETQILGSGWTQEYTLTTQIHRAEISLSFAEQEALERLFPTSEIPGAVCYSSQLTEAVLSLKEGKRAKGKITLQLDIWHEVKETKETLSHVSTVFNRDLQTTVNDVFTERKAELKGEDGRSVSIEDLNISWQDSRLVVGGVVSPNLKGERGADAPVPDALIGSVWESGYIDENDGTTIGGSSVDVHCPEYYPIYSGADIRLTSDYVEGAIGGWSLLFFYDKNREFISATRYTEGRNAVELSLKAPGNAYYLRLSKLSSAHVVRLYTLLRGVQISDLTTNAEFMQLTASKVSEVGRFVTQEVVNSTISGQITTLKPEQRMVSRQGNLPYTVVLDSPESHDVGKVIEYDFIPSLQCVPGDGRVYSPYEVFSGNMVLLPKTNHTIDAPHRNACFSNHYEFKVVLHNNRKVWLWSNYEIIKFSETEGQVRTQAAQIEGVEATANRLNGESINTRSRLLDVENQFITHGQKLVAQQHDIDLLKQGKIHILSNKTSTAEGGGTLNMTHNDTPATFRLPTPSEGSVCLVWANHWVSSTKTLHKPLSPSNSVMINTATSSEVSSIALTKGHLYQCIAINATTWLVTDLSR